MGNMRNSALRVEDIRSLAVIVMMPHNLKKNGRQAP